jgi:ribosomal protein S18 acetylase RimI-like enzyme
MEVVYLMSSQPVTTLNLEHSKSGSMQPQPGLIVRDIGPFADEYLALVATAEASYSRFVFTTDQQAAHYRRLLFAKGIAEHSPPAARLLLVDGKLVGALALATKTLLSKRRLATAWTLSRDPELQRDQAMLQRMRLSASTFVAVEEGDLYISRIAVETSMSGKGLGTRLLEEAIVEGREISARRCILDVDTENLRAHAFYARHGFIAVGESSVTDVATGRTLSHRHLALTI